MTVLDVTILDHGDAGFSLNWPDRAPLPGVGETICLDGVGGGVEVEVVRVTHFVSCQEPRVDIFLYVRLSTSYLGGELISTLKGHPLVSEVQPPGE